MGRRHDTVHDELQSLLSGRVSRKRVSDQLVLIDEASVAHVYPQPPVVRRNIVRALGELERDIHAYDNCHIVVIRSVDPWVSIEDAKYAENELAKLIVARNPRQDHWRWSGRVLTGGLRALLFGYEWRKTKHGKIVMTEKGHQKMKEASERYETSKKTS
ncbi:MAG: hypothetical protein R3E01_19830 [Pirellulaceae bacterium]